MLLKPAKSTACLALLLFGIFVRVKFLFTYLSQTSSLFLSFLCVNQDSCHPPFSVVPLPFPPNTVALLYEKKVGAGISFSLLSSRLQIRSSFWFSPNLSSFPPQPPKVNVIFSLLLGFWMFPLSTSASFFHPHLDSLMLGPPSSLVG